LPAGVESGLHVSTHVEQTWDGFVLSIGLSDPDVAKEILARAKTFLACEGDGPESH
jgi:hypothetical protein